MKTSIQQHGSSDNQNAFSNKSEYAILQIKFLALLKQHMWSP